MSHRVRLLVVMGWIVAGLLLVACSQVESTPTPAPKPMPTPTPTPLPQKPTAAAATGVPTQAAAVTQLIDPADLVYRGAFRLPGSPDGMGWEYGGAAMTYYPQGDPDGSADGYPGSIFATGHDWYQHVSEICVPVPVISPGKDVSELNTAATLQDFHDIRGGLFEQLDFEIPRSGLEYLPKQAEQTTDKLHFCCGQHYQEGGASVSHGWSELDLSNPQPAGAWYVGGHSNYATNDYLFAIPESWADLNTPGMLLVTGRFRDGGWGGQGPSLLAYGPWNEGNPPPRGSHLPAVPLLLYADSRTPSSLSLNGYHHSDEWTGGAWLTAGERSAVVFIGTKGQGECWYGFANGVVWPDEPPYPPVPDPPYDDRGWWSTSFVGQMLFFDPADLAAVARGEMATHEPQPYAALEIDDYLFHIESTQQKHHVGAASLDRQRGLLYIFDPFGDGDRPLIHIWAVEG